VSNATLLRDYIPGCIGSLCSRQGMSRSPAVAAAICLGLGEDSTRFFEEYQPNQHVYRLALAEAPSDPSRLAGE